MAILRWDYVAAIIAGVMFVGSFSDFLGTGFVASEPSFHLQPKITVGKTKCIRRGLTSAGKAAGFGHVGLLRFRPPEKFKTYAIWDPLFEIFHPGSVPPDALSDAASEITDSTAVPGSFGPWAQASATIVVCSIYSRLLFDALESLQGHVKDITELLVAKIREQEDELVDLLRAHAKVVQNQEHIVSQQEQLAKNQKLLVDFLFELSNEVDKAQDFLGDRQEKFQINRHKVYANRKRAKRQREVVAENVHNANSCEIDRYKRLSCRLKEQLIKSEPLCDLNRVVTVAELVDLTENLQTIREDMRFLRSSDRV